MGVRGKIMKYINGLRYDKVPDIENIAYEVRDNGISHYYPIRRDLDIYDDYKFIDGHFYKWHKPKTL